MIDAIPRLQDTVVATLPSSYEPRGAGARVTVRPAVVLVWEWQNGGLQLDIDRTTLIGRELRSAIYTVTEVDVNDFLGVVDEPGFAATREITASAADNASLAPPSFAPFVAVLGLLKTFDWQDDFLFDYRTGTAMFGEQSIEFHRPLRVGELVAIAASISDVCEKQGKSLFDVIEVTFEITGSAEGDRLMSGQQSYILSK